MKKFTTERFINKANKIHNYYYTYEDSVYTKNNQELIITCPIHGKFKQKPSYHLLKHGCKKCGQRSWKKTTKEFVNESILIHKNDYSYDKVNYVNAHKKVIITCPKHGDFLQTPHSHLKGSGCLSCSGRRKIRNNNSWLYFIKITNQNETFYKVGFTNLTVKERFKYVFKNTNYKYEIIESCNLPDTDCMRMEKQVHKILCDYKYKPNFKFNGYTECFTNLENIRQVLFKVKEDYIKKELLCVKN